MLIKGSAQRLCKRHYGVYFWLMQGVIFVVIVHLVNTEKLQYWNGIVIGPMRQADFYPIEIFGSYVGINLNGLATLLSQLVISLVKSG